MSVENNVESVKSDVGCLTFIAIVFVVLWLVNTFNHGKLGMDCDRSEWLKFRELVKKELERRK
jgi:hypothetical protein